MPDGGFHVHPEELERHEQELRLLLDKMPDATETLTDPWAPDVFGVVGMFFANGLNGWNEEAAKFVGMSKAAGNHLADNLQQMRRLYVSTEGDMAKAFDLIVETLDSRTSQQGEGDK